MNIETVIEMLKEIRGGRDFTMTHMSAIGYAIDMLEEAEETMENNIKVEPKAIGFAYGCAYCGEEVGTIYSDGTAKKNRFCPKCGQKVDWKDGN